MCIQSNFEDWGEGKNFSSVHTRSIAKYDKIKITQGKKLSMQDLLKWKMRLDENCTYEKSNRHDLHKCKMRLDQITPVKKSCSNDLHKSWMRFDQNYTGEKTDLHKCQKKSWIIIKVVKISRRYHMRKWKNMPAYVQSSICY